MKHLVIILFSLFFGFQLSAQELNEKKSYERIRVGFGAESLHYVDWPVSTFGYKAEIHIPIYKRFALNLNYVDHSSYFDYCDEIPVNVQEKHFVYGLTYTFLDRSRWTVGSLIALDMERTRYTERDNLPAKAEVRHKEDAHHEDHSYLETYTEFMIGVEANYVISPRVSLNVASRINTYGAFRNSVNLFYTFGVNK